MHVLSKAELAVVDHGPRTHVHVPGHAAYDYKRVNRSRQASKNKTIEDFAVKFLNQIRRWGISQDDQRHMNQLIRLMDVAVERQRRASAKAQRAA